MGEKPWWVKAVELAVASLVMASIGAWLSKNRKPAERAAGLGAGAVVLRASGILAVLGYVTTGLFFVATVASALHVKPQEWWVPLLFFGFALLGVPLIAEGRLVQHTLTSQGIAYCGLFRSHEVRWESIRKAYWNPGLKWLVLETNDGRVLRFSGILNGLDELARRLEQHVPALEAKPATAQFLADARQGILPSYFS